jgi:hypothetical protein
LISLRKSLRSIAHAMLLHAFQAAFSRLLIVDRSIVIPLRLCPAFVSSPHFQVYTVSTESQEVARFFSGIPGSVRIA